MDSLIIENAYFIQFFFENLFSPKSFSFITKRSNPKFQNAIFNETCCW